MDLMKKTVFPNEQGFMLLTVIVLIMALTVVIIGFMSVSVSQVTSSQSIIDSIKAEEEAKGLIFRYHAARLSNVTTSFVSTSTAISLDEKTLTSSTTVIPDVGTNQTDRVLVQTNY